MDTFIWIILAVAAICLGLSALMVATAIWEESKSRAARLDELHELEVEKMRLDIQLR